MNLNDILIECQDIKDKFLIRKTTYNNLYKTRCELVESIEQKEREADILEQARILLAESSKYAREQVKVQLEQMVTSGLQYAFADDISFEIELTKSGGRTEADFYIAEDWEGKRWRRKPDEARGGSVSDIVSLTIREAFLQTTTPCIQGPLLIDEPAKMLDPERVVKIGEFLLHLNTSYGRQVIMTTHNTYMAEMGEKKFEVTKQDRKSRVREVNFC